jgi:hypothetical protein
MKRRPSLLLYLLLNILVSAATTLAVLWAWDNVWGASRRSAAPAAPLAQNTPQAPAPEATKIGIPLASGSSQQATATPVIPQETAGPTETPLPADARLIEVVSIVGAGDLRQEVVLLRRVGEGNLRMVGWKLVGEHKNTYTFPDQPELILYKDGAVQVYSRDGTDTVTEVYWNRSEAAWRSGELVRLLDPQGNERAVFQIP